MSTIYGVFEKKNILLQSTIGAAYGARKVFVNDRKSILLGLWDTAGSERYTSMSRMFYRCAKAAIICYDVTNDKTWDKVRFWAGEVLRFEEACNIYLVGTKLDLMVILI
jgi:Ras-related protein Rab-24